MSTLPVTFPRVPLEQMDPALLWFELDRETHRVMPQDRELITSTASMASFLHREQTRFVRGAMERVPYIEHPLRVALRLIRWGVRDAELVAAALLHDVAEDCSEELLEVFGSAGRSCGQPTDGADEDAFGCLAHLYGTRVAGLVADVTNPKTCGSSSAEGRANYLAHIETLVEQMGLSLLIKASDLKDNAGSIKYQLGHGKDARMLRMLTKYLPAARHVADGMFVMATLEQPADIEIAVRNAASDMQRLVLDLERLAFAYDIVKPS